MSQMWEGGWRGGGLGGCEVDGACRRVGETMREMVVSSWVFVCTLRPSSTANVGCTMWGDANGVLEALFEFELVQFGGEGRWGKGSYPPLTNTVCGKAWRWGRDGL